MPTKKYSNKKREETVNANSGVIGVVLIIISVFFLLCIFFSKFSVLSLMIRNVLIGLIGYTAFPLFFSLIILGIALIQNKKASLATKNIVCIVSIGLSLIFLLQFATTQAYMTDISNYIDNVYNTSTLGGVLFGIIAYGISMAITAPLTYALFVIVILILLALLFFDIFGVRGKKRRNNLREKREGETKKRGFVKGSPSNNLMRTVNNNGLFVETIVPTQAKREDAIISQSGKFDEIPSKSQPTLSKYNSGKVEFESYHKDKESIKNKTHKMLFEQSKEERLLSYGTKSQAFSSSSGSNASDSQRDLFERHVSNFIPGVGSAPKAQNLKNDTNKYGIKPETDIAAKYGLREIAVPPSKKFSDKYVHGTILDGDEISDNLRNNNKEPESQEPVGFFAKTASSAPYIIDGSKYGSADTNNKHSANFSDTEESENAKNEVNNRNNPYSGIINGDFFTKEERENLQKREEERRAEEQRREEIRYEELRREEQRRNELRHEELRREEQRKEELRKLEFEKQRLADAQKREETDRLFNNAQKSVESEYDLCGRNSSFEALLKADKAINRSINNDMTNLDESRSINQENGAFEDDYYEPFIKQEDLSASNEAYSNVSEIAENVSETTDNTGKEEVNDGYLEADSDRVEINNNFDNDQVDYRIYEDEHFEKTPIGEDEFANNSDDLSDCVENHDLLSRDDEALETKNNFGGQDDQDDNLSVFERDNHNESDIDSTDELNSCDDGKFGIRIEDEIIDKSETNFDEKYQTGYYQREGEESLTQKENRESDIRLADDFRSKVNHIESNIFANKSKPSSQINIDDYLRSAAPITEKPIVKRKRSFKYVPPPVDLLLDNSTDPSLYGGDCEKKAVILEDTLRSLKFPSKVIGITKGPAVTRYEMETTPGIPIKRVENCAKDIAYALASDGKIRIETPIPGRRAVGVEVPNEKISTVCLRDIISSKEFITAPSPLTLAVGKDITGSVIVSNLEKMPHLLIAGATGTGKSVCLNSIITSILYKSSPEDVRLILIDPKRVEFAVFKDMPHLLMKNIITEPPQVMNAFRWAKDEMERRYKLFSRYVNKNIQEFNNSNHVKSGSEPKMPYIVIIVDELSDLMMPHSNCRRELEDKIMSMAQKARAAGIHLILATQRPSVDVITGTIKANLPSRIAFAVTSIPDSRTILDQSGAEALLGKGDMLYSPLDWSDPRRVQGAFITSEEVEAVVEYVKENNEFDFDDEAEKLIMREEQENEAQEDAAEESQLDPHIKEALKRVIETGQASASMIQRRFSVGYARAARIMDQMEANKFIGPSEGAKPREVYITREQFREIFGEDV